MKSLPMQESAQERSHVTRASHHVGGLIFCSRILGLLRDKVLVLLFGAVPWMLDSFILAFTIPNLFRRILGEGALTAAFLPEYVEAREAGRAEATALSSSILTLLLMVTGLIAGTGMFGCGLALVFLEPDERIALTLRLLILMLPFLTLICVSAYLSAMLQGAKKFSVPAAMSSLLNLALLAACGYLLYLHWPMDEATAHLSWGQKALAVPVRMTEAMRHEGLGWVAYAVLAAGLAQILVQWPLVRATGISLRIHLNLADTRVRAVLAALAPTALGLGIVQLNVFVDNMIAYSLSLRSVDGVAVYEGATTYLYLGNRLMQLPLGVFGIALATTAFPFLAEYAAKKKAEDYLDCLLHAIRMLVFWVLPASFGLMVLAAPFIRLLYQDPDLTFTDAAVYRSTAVLVCYAGGLVFFAVNQILTRAFYARKDYVTPVRIAVGMVAVNLLLNLTLIHAPDLYRHWGDVVIPGMPGVQAWGQGYLDNATQGLALGEAGLALATTLTAMLNCLLLWGKLRTSLRDNLPESMWDGRTGTFFARLFWITLSAIAMGVVTYWTRGSIPYGPELIWRAQQALVPILVSVLAYAMACMIFAVDEYRETVGALRNRLRRRPE